MAESPARVPPPPPRPKEDWSIRLDNWSDRLNPILVRELRQIFKSRQFIGAFGVLLLTAWIAAAWIVLLPQTLGNFGALQGADFSTSLGRPLLAMIFAILSCVLFFPVPMTAFHSFTLEYKQDALEMLQVTILPAPKIVWGKIYACLIQGMVYLSALMPFLYFSYLLQGVGIFTIFGLLGVTLFTCLALTTAGLAAGSLAKTPLSQVFYSLAMLFLTAISVLVFLGISMELVLGRLSEFSIFGLGCVLIPYFVIFLVAAGIALNQIRPLQHSTMRVDFIDLPRLQATVESMREFIALNRQLDEIYESGRTHRELRADERAIRLTNEAVRQAYLLDRMMNHSRKIYFRMNFVTYSPALGAMLKVRQTFDNLLIGRSWLDMSGVQFEKIYFPRFNPHPQEELIHLLEQGVAELETAIATIRVEIAAEEAIRPRSTAQTNAAPFTS